MLGKEIYKIWAPKSKWQGWVRPVVFASMDGEIKEEYFNKTLEEIVYISKDVKDTAIIVDLPGAESVKEGLSLAKQGFIPVAVYNGINEQHGAISTVDNSPLELALIWGASILKDLKFSSDAAPTFLLDSNRANSFKINPSIYDNSWDVYSQDMPTANYLLKNDIKKVLLVSDVIRADINKILHSYKNEGIEILYTEGVSEPVIAKLPKPKKDID